MREEGESGIPYWKAEAVRRYKSLKKTSENKNIKTRATIVETPKNADSGRPGFRGAHSNGGLIRILGKVNLSIQRSNLSITVLGWTD